jgi:hypothetical protein
MHEAARRCVLGERLFRNEERTVVTAILGVANGQIWKSR